MKKVKIKKSRLKQVVKKVLLKQKIGPRPSIKDLHGARTKRRQHLDRRQDYMDALTFYADYHMQDRELSTKIDDMMMQVRQIRTAMGQVMQRIEAKQSEQVSRLSAQ